MPWILDGNNLAGGRDRERVRRAALALARAERVRLVVFFDGAPPPGVPQIERLGAVEIRYVRNADQAIVELLGSRGQGWRVATDDRELAGRVRGTGATVVDAAALWARVAASGSAPDDREVGASEPSRGFLDGVEPLAGAPGRVRRRRRPGIRR